MSTATAEADRPTESLADNPAVLLAGGVALGVVVGMLLPRVAKERELLDPIGRSLADRTQAAVAAAKEAGKAEIESLVPDRAATQDRVTALLGSILSAAAGPTRG
jgi:hypothetical protein